MAPDEDDWTHVPPFWHTVFEHEDEVWQNEPEKPTPHEQTALPTEFTEHVPPFWHGFFRQEFSWVNTSIHFYENNFKTGK